MADGKALLTYKHALSVSSDAHLAKTVEYVSAKGHHLLRRRIIDLTFLLSGFGQLLIFRMLLLLV